eukprot:TRINITY_DN70547_c0_g1_i1.p1 TRINITY_DN70547_c0_g1~~TRINITY_DN70547_c0_g1_i1.p1  ORF type:complete len:365 (-),score=48.76 TRINITY_DN70547_c0_g1_i1:16-1110(-)
MRLNCRRSPPGRYQSGFRSSLGTLAVLGCVFGTLRCLHNLGTGQASLLQGGAFLAAPALARQRLSESSTVDRLQHCGRRHAAQVAAFGTLLPLALDVPGASAEEPATSPAGEAKFKEGMSLFENGDFSRSEKTFREAIQLGQDDGYTNANLGTVVLLNTAKTIKLDEPLTSEASKRLEEALGYIEKSIVKGMGEDGVVLNTRGNAFNLLRRWPEAAEAYQDAVRTSDYDFQAMPWQNLALAHYESGDDKQAEREAERLLRSHPEFVDARAFLVALRWSRGDPVGAESAWMDICEGEEPVKATMPVAKVVEAAGLALGVSKYAAGKGKESSELCSTYNKMDSVRGRWPPRAMAAYESFLARRDKA